MTYSVLIPNVFSFKKKKIHHSSVMPAGACMGVVASSQLGRNVTLRKLRVRRTQVAESDSIIDFYELYLLSSSNQRFIPITSTIIPSAAIGTSANLFDSNHTTRWHSTRPTGGTFIDEISTPQGYDFTFADDITLRLFSRVSDLPE